jgi:uracil-DNA glycosylase family 4
MNDLCFKCELSIYRKRMVFGVGTGKSGIMLLGTSPTVGDDRSGKPFTGRAGKFLKKTIKTAGFKESDLFITLAVKCRPFNNRQPTMLELDACRYLLQKEVDSHEFDMIITFGSASLSTVYNKTMSATYFQGKILRKGKVTIIPMFHPNYVLYNPATLPQWIEGWLKVVKHYRQFVPYHQEQLKKLKI